MSTPGDVRSCLNCPSYVADPVKVTSKFKKSTGAPMCARFGHVLGRPGATESQVSQIGKHFAGKCPAYGEAPPGAPLEYRMQVALPDPEALSQLDDGDVKKTAVSSCGQCAKFIPDRVVARELGWTAGLCSAKGKLILLPRQVYEARDCDFRQMGPVRADTNAVTILPEYEDAFNLSVDPVKAFFKTKREGGPPEPAEYETDKPVSDEEKASGIHAWRRIKDPNGTDNEVYLPVYDPAYFDEEERAKIPRTGDDEHPELYVDHFGGAYLAAVCWGELDETPALWGAAGVGKTELYRYLAWIMCLPFYRISITARTEVDDLMGKMHFDQEKGTYFKYGRLVEAWTKPCVLVLDEPNTAQGEVWQILRPLTDNSKQMAVDQNEGEIKDRHTDCYLGMAMNHAWDVRNIGAEPIADADANRLFHVFVDIMPPELEREVIKARVKLDGWEIDDKRLDAMMKIAEELRGLSDEGTLPVSWMVRPQIKVARAMRWFDAVTAYRRAIADYLEPEAQEALLTVVRSHVDGGRG